MSDPVPVRIVLKEILSDIARKTYMRVLVMRYLALILKGA